MRRSTRELGEAADALLADSGESSEDVEVEQALPRRRAPVASSSRYTYTIDVASCSRSSSGLSSPRHDRDKPPRSSPSLGSPMRGGRKLVRFCALLAAGGAFGSFAGVDTATLGVMLAGSAAFISAPYCALRTLGWAFLAWCAGYVAFVVERPVLHFAPDATNVVLTEGCSSLHEWLSPTLWAFSSGMQNQLHQWLKKRARDPVTFTRQLLHHNDGGETALEWMNDDEQRATRSSNALPSQRRQRRCPPPRVSLPPSRSAVCRSLQSLQESAPLLVVLHSMLAGSFDQYSLSPFLRAARRQGWRAVVHARRGHADLPMRVLRWNTVRSSPPRRAPPARPAP